MAEQAGYPSWPAIAQAIKAAAAKRAAAAGGKGPTVGDQIQMATFDRFLSRVFSEDDGSEWMLKGGTAMLARVPRARRTQDVDLASRGDLQAAVDDLKRLAATELGDHLRFTYAREERTGLGDNQPDVETRKVVFACWAGQKKVGEVHVDVAVGAPPVGKVEVREPANRLELGRPLRSHNFRLYPLSDQVAEKVCATMSTAYPGGKRSSRVKDLVDLVVIAQTQELDQRELQQAIATKRLLSGIPEFERLTIPEDWPAKYAKLAQGTPAAEAAPTAAAAMELMDEFLTPVLSAQPVPAGQTWTPAPPSEPIAGDVWVEPHTRGGTHVVGHWRSARGSGNANG